VTYPSGIPAQLADRLMVVSREDYVLMLDENPDLLKDERVTVVPVPLLGRWIEFPELRDADLIPGDGLIRDVDTNRYNSADTALRSTARTKARLLLQVCQHLGAKSVRINEQAATSDEAATANTLKAGMSGTLTEQVGKNTDRVNQERELTATLAMNVRRQLRLEIESHGQWPGGEPDIAAARKVIEGQDHTIDTELHTLIQMRATAHNRVDNYGVTIDFYSELHRHFSLLADLAGRFDATIAKRSLGIQARLSNTFERNKIASQYGKLAFDVWFVDSPHGP
jgi:hypothetical protein